MTPQGRCMRKVCLRVADQMSKTCLKRWKNGSCLSTPKAASFLSQIRDDLLNSWVYSRITRNCGLQRYALTLLGAGWSCTTFFILVKGNTWMEINSFHTDTFLMQVGDMET